MNEYNKEVCPLCKKQMLCKRRTTPRGLPKLDNQIYLVCDFCKTGWCKIK